MVNYLKNRLGLPFFINYVSMEENRLSPAKMTLVIAYNLQISSFRVKSLLFLKIKITLLFEPCHLYTKIYRLYSQLPKN